MSSDSDSPSMVATLAVGNPLGITPSRIKSFQPIMTSSSSAFDTNALTCLPPIFTNTAPTHFRSESSAATSFSLALNSVRPYARCTSSDITVIVHPVSGSAEKEKGVPRPFGVIFTGRRGVGLATGRARCTTFKMRCLITDAAPFVSSSLSDSPSDVAGEGLRDFDEIELALLFFLSLPAPPFSLFGFDESAPPLFPLLLQIVAMCPGFPQAWHLTSGGYLHSALKCFSSPHRWKPPFLLPPCPPWRPRPWLLTWPAMAFPLLLSMDDSIRLAISKSVTFLL